MSLLNTLAPEIARKDKKRVGRGMGSGKGKTCGRGHKGQKARSGGFHKVGFEGGQMPIQRRVPKFGFTSRKSMVSESVRSSDLNLIDADIITVDVLIEAGVVRSNTKFVKVFSSGEITRPLKLKGIRVTASIKEAIEKAGGSVD
jgi:large subunit ribosomal protein L15